jgi:hypothetical protein
MEMLELLETLRTQDASVGNLFGDAGQSVRFGRAPRIAASRAEYQRKISEAARFLAEIKTGRRPVYQLREAMTTSDFPYLFGDILDRQVLANYQEAPQTYRNYCKINTVSDFRLVKRFRVDGSEAVLPAVGQQEEYPESKLTDGGYSYQVSKFGRRTPFAWETIINDDLSALEDIPRRYGRAARRSEEKFATTLFSSSSGPLSTLYSAGNKNQVIKTNGAVSADNPAFSINGMQDALIVLMSQKDKDGEPIAIESVEVVYPPALHVIVENVLNATQLWLNENGGATNTRLISTNWMKGMLRPDLNYYLPIVDTTHGSTAWYLFASPANGRPALEVGFLRGHETPEIFMKQPNAVRVGGGPINPTDGDFDTDSVQYKIRHVFGGTQLDPVMTVASTGTGSA